jgi:hypothetical protein
VRPQQAAQRSDQVGVGDGGDMTRGHDRVDDEAIGIASANAEKRAWPRPNRPRNSGDTCGTCGTAVAGTTAATASQKTRLRVEVGSLFVGDGR